MSSAVSGALKSDNGDADIPVVQGRPPPTNPDFYKKWGEENAKDAIKNANTALSQMLTISTTLLAGMVALWNALQLSDTFKILFAICVLGNVLVCLFSAMPMKGQMDPQSASSVKTHMNALFARKLRRLTVAKLSLATALILITIGVVLHGTALDAQIDVWFKSAVSLIGRVVAKS
jgi:hypothetical protein